MKQKKKWIIAVCIIGLLLAAVVVTVVFFMVRYFNYNEYKRYVRSYEVEEGHKFVPLPDVSADVPGMVLAAENEELKLYTNLSTTEIAVYEKATGHITYSNPVDRAEDSLANGVNMQLLNSTINVVYYNSAGVRSTMNNFNMSIQHDQFEIEALENGIRYVYTLKDPANSTGIIPSQISEERMQTLILDKLDAEDAKKLITYFTLKDGVYTLNESATKSRINMNRMNRTFEECGYTQEDYELDMEGVEGDENISFVIPLEYRLTGDGLEVSVPVSMIHESGGAFLARIQILPMFGAAGKEAEGYMVVPDGSGALIQLNNGTRNAAYSQNVYGIDPVVQGYLVTELTENVRIPVFGMKDGESAFLGRITGGDALANINANVSGNINSYNYIYTEFSLREIELLNMFGLGGTQADVPVVENDLYNENLSVTYSFLSGENADYSGMANAYRNQLIAEGILSSSGADGDIPFYLDILGGVETQEHFMGVPYRGVFAMTTYEEANEILDQIYRSGIDNVRMNYLGWFNGGVYHDVADKVKLIGALGSRKELEELSERLEDNGGKLFMDVAFCQVPYTSGRFNYLLEASKYYSGYVVSMGVLNPATMRQTSNLGWYDELVYYVASPKFLPWYVEHFRNQLDNYGVSGITLRDLGSVLASDKKRTEVINRQDAEEIVMAQFEGLCSSNMSLMANNGNAYAFGYVTDIIDAPTLYSKFYIVDEQIPFYEMVIHGSIDYAGESLNLMDRDVDEELVLSWIEYGVSPRFTFSYKDSSNIKYTSSADMYSVSYTTWMEEAQEVYARMNAVLSKVQGAAMVHHQTLESGLAEVRYDNGVIIYINKTEDAVSVDGITVDAMNYEVVGGAG